MSKYETIIGLEIHLQLKTKSKMFCGCSNDGANQPVNTVVCPVCLGHPGTLPTVNKEAIKQGIMMALALNCDIKNHSKFDRKNYFYPDLPKGYQISQFDEPLAEDGHLIIDLNNQHYKIGIERLHMEEDAAKNIHKNGKTLVDFNRGGTPLAEIVTRPDFRTPDQTKIFLQDVRLIARYLEVSDADMEKGQMRCDANISLRPMGDKELYHKTEVKNLNSFKAVVKALQYEKERQTILWDDNKPPKITATRGWDEAKQITVEQRTKEGSADYRYFPEPDLPPLIIEANLLQEIKSLMPELPNNREDRFVEEYDLKSADARVLISLKHWADYFEEIMSDLRAWLFKDENIASDSHEADVLWQDNKQALSKLAYNWLSSELFGLIDTSFDIKNLKITAENFAELLKLIYRNKLNSSAAQTVLKAMFDTGDDPSHIMDDLDLAQVDDDSVITGFVDEVIKNNPQQVEDYKAGKTVLLKFFVGKVMAASKGKANPQKIEVILKNKL